MTALKHFLDLDQLDTATVRSILDLGTRFKTEGHGRVLDGKALALVFEKPSTRTRVSFEVGMRQLGGDVVTLTDHDTQIGRGETIADTARVLSRYVDAIMMRTDEAAKLREMAAHATVPVINGLTDATHPCQIMADVMTYEQHRGSLKGRIVTWSGDGNNVAASWIHGAVHFGYEIRLACPKDLSPNRDVVRWAEGKGARVILTTDPNEAAEGAHCMVTDTWVSMGDKDAAARHKLLEPFRVDEALMKRAHPDALFMHCLPAHRGEEVTAAVLDGPQSVVWDEAENRLHAQKGILAWCLG